MIMYIGISVHNILYTVYVCLFIDLGLVNLRARI